MNASQDPAQSKQFKARGRTRATRQITDEPRALLAHPEIRNRLVDCDFRLLSLRFTDSDVKSVDPRSRNRFIASFFDYTNGRMLLAQGDVAGLDIDSPGSIEVDDVFADPPPSADEFTAAVHVLRYDRAMRGRIDEGSLEPYAPVPPVLDSEMPAGRRDRSVAIGLRENDGARSAHRIAGANMFSRRLIDIGDRFHIPATQALRASPGAGSCPSTGTTGQVTVTVRGPRGARQRPGHSPVRHCPGRWPGGPARTGTTHAGSEDRAARSPHWRLETIIRSAARFPRQRRRPPPA